MPGLGLCAAGDLAKHFHLWKTKRETGKKRKEKVKEKRMEGEERQEEDTVGARNNRSNEWEK